MDCKVCPKCEAKFMDGQLYWATGQKGDPEVLANLVCDLPQVQRGGGCINKAGSNPKKDTWEKRQAFADAMADEVDLPRNFLPGFDD